MRDRRLRWHQVETEHCTVAYPEGLAVLARRAAFLCERSRAQLAEVLDHLPEDRIYSVLTDDSDAANGSATVLPYNAVRLFVQFRILWMLVTGLYASGRVMIWSFCLIFILIFAFAVIGVEFLAPPQHN